MKCCRNTRIKQSLSIQGQIYKIHVVVRHLLIQIWCAVHELKHELSWEWKNKKGSWSKNWALQLKIWMYGDGWEWMEERMVFSNPSTQVDHRVYGWMGGWMDRQTNRWVEGRHGITRKNLKDKIVNRKISTWTKLESIAQSLRINAIYISYKHDKKGTETKGGSVLVADHSCIKILQDAERKLAAEELQTLRWYLLTFYQQLNRQRSCTLHCLTWDVIQTPGECTAIETSGSQADQMKNS